MQTEDNLRAGMDPDEARCAARRRFGGQDAMKERYRDRRALPLVETIAQDVRYALRADAPKPGLHRGCGPVAGVRYRRKRRIL